MKKLLIILSAMLLALTGCGEEEVKIRAYTVVTAEGEFAVTSAKKAEELNLLIGTAAGGKEISLENPDYSCTYICMSGFENGEKTEEYRVSVEPRLSAVTIKYSPDSVGNAGFSDEMLTFTFAADGETIEKLSKPENFIDTEEKE